MRRHLGDVSAGEPAGPPAQAPEPPVRQRCRARWCGTSAVPPAATPDASSPTEPGAVHYSTSMGSRALYAGLPHLAVAGPCRRLCRRLKRPVLSCPALARRGTIEARRASLTAVGHQPDARPAPGRPPPGRTAALHGRDAAPGRPLSPRSSRSCGVQYPGSCQQHVEAPVGPAGSPVRARLLTGAVTQCEEIVLRSAFDFGCGVQRPRRRDGR